MIGRVDLSCCWCFLFRLSLELVDSRSHSLSFLPFTLVVVCRNFSKFPFTIASKSVLLSPLVSMIGIGIVNVNCTSLFSSVALGFLVIFPSYHACPRLRLRSNDFLLLLFSFLFHPCYSINCCRKFSFFSLSMSSISPTSSDHLLRRSIHTHARVVSVFLSSRRR